MTTVPGKTINEEIEALKMMFIYEVVLITMGRKIIQRNLVYKTKNEKRPEVSL